MSLLIYALFSLNQKNPYGDLKTAYMNEVVDVITHWFEY